MTDRHQGGNRGEDRRGGYTGGPRRGGSGGPAGDRGGKRPSGGFSRGGSGSYGGDRRGDDRRGGYRGGKPGAGRDGGFSKGGPSSGRGGYRGGRPSDDRRGGYRDGGAPANRGGFRGDKAGFDRRDDRRDDRFGDRRGGYRDSRSGDRTGGRFDDRKGGFRKDDRKGDFRRDDRKGGFRGDRRDDRFGDRRDDRRGGSGAYGKPGAGRGAGGRPPYKKSGDRPYGDKRQGAFRGPRDDRRAPYAGPRRDDDRRRSDDRRGRGAESFERRDAVEQHDAPRPFSGSVRAASRFGQAVGAPSAKPAEAVWDEKRSFDDAPRRDARDRGGRAHDGERRGGKGAPGRAGRDGDRRGPREGGFRDRRDDGFRSRGFQRTELTKGRAAACAIGRAVRERDAFVTEVTPGIVARFEGISPEDAAFATKIARGVTATLGTLDEFIDRNLRSPDDIEADVRDALRVSAYELVFLGKDAYAAVDQGVELVRSVQPKAAGLANSVLRKMSESAKKFPYGNPDLNLQVLARSQAFPLWLAKRLISEMGLKQATDFMAASNADAPVYVAINAIKAEDAAVIEVFDQAGSLMEPSAEVAGCYRVKDPRVLRRPEVRALFENGSVCVSDESAQAIAALACPEGDVESFLEIGAGRGTKTILMQSDAVRRIGRTIPMVSVDDHAFKTELLAKRAAAYGIQSVRPLTADARTLSEKLPPASFDAVLVDAPCSGVGTLRRHPEIRWRLTPEQIEDMAALEYGLLAEAAAMVKPGGALTYATCTVFAEENDRVVERFLASEAGQGFAVEKTVRTALCATGADAHYAVRLRRAD